MATDVTHLIDAARAGDDGAVSDLVATLHAELRSIAARQLASERKGHTLQPTALVHEAYVRLVQGARAEWDGKGAFLSYASTAMRRVLLEHARARLADRRGGGGARVTLFEVASPLEDEPEAVVALDEALVAFAEIDAQGARIVELRWFGGLSVAEVAALLGVSDRTVERSWRAARAWLARRVSEVD
ncbi:MAG: ECF-type sigma factor [Planctomycetota bacterium]